MQVLALASSPGGLAAPGDDDAAAAAAALLAGLSATCPPDACALDVAQVTQTGFAGFLMCVWGDAKTEYGFKQPSAMCPMPRLALPQ